MLFKSKDWTNWRFLRLNFGKGVVVIVMVSQKIFSRSMKWFMELKLISTNQTTEDWTCKKLSEFLISCQKLTNSVASNFDVIFIHKNKAHLVATFFLKLSEFYQFWLVSWFFLHVGNYALLISILLFKAFSFEFEITQVCFELLFYISVLLQSHMFKT